jgi:hypothetical protein
MYGRRLEAPPLPLLGLVLGATLPAYASERWWLTSDPPKRQDAANRTPKDQYRLAAEALERYLPHAPNDARLRFKITLGYFKAGGEARWRNHAEEALRLDEAATRQQRKLEDGQRERLRKWLERPSETAGGE